MRTHNVLSSLQNLPRIAFKSSVYCQGCSVSNTSLSVMLLTSTSIVLLDITSFTLITLVKRSCGKTIFMQCKTIWRRRKIQRAEPRVSISLMGLTNAVNISHYRREGGHPFKVYPLNVYNMMLNQMKFS